MKLVDRSLALAAVTAIAVSTVTAVRAQNQPNAYVVNKLVSDLPNMAAVQDPNLKNAWGSRLVRPRARSGSPITPMGCQRFMTVTARSRLSLSQSPAHRQQGRDRVARNSRRPTAWCGTRPRPSARHSWSREHSYPLRSSSVPRTGRYPRGPEASPRQTTQSSPSTIL